MPTFPFGAHIAVVEVDTETGAVTLQRIVAVDDAGTLINPLIAEGQVHGGLAAGIGQALYEEMPYDETGNPQNANFVGYAFPAATELPMFETVAMQTPTPANPLGAKGIGESGTIGSTPAVHNAVIDALAPYGSATSTCPSTARSCGGRCRRRGRRVAAKDAHVLELAGREVRITSPDKVLFARARRDQARPRPLLRARSPSR